MEMEMEWKRNGGGWVADLDLPGKAQVALRLSPGPGQGDEEERRGTWMGSVLVTRPDGCEFQGTVFGGSLASSKEALVGAAFGFVEGGGQTSEPEATLRVRIALSLEASEAVAQVAAMYTQALERGGVVLVSLLRSGVADGRLSQAEAEEFAVAHQNRSRACAQAATAAQSRWVELWQQAVAESRRRIDV